MNRQTLKRIFYFFPIQLLVVHLKKNHFLLFFWLILFGLITQSLATRYGIPFLFLDPEYLDKVSFMSYFITGFACGGFVMAFNISSYANNAFRFPFLATLSNPFLKYCINNCILPLTFIITYFFLIISFQKHNTMKETGEIMMNASGFLAGNFLFIFLSLAYFFSVNKDLFRMFGIKMDPSGNIETTHKTKRIFMMRDVKKSIKRMRSQKRDWHCETYLVNLYKIGLTRSTEHYDKEMLMKVFVQNHRSAVLFELFTILTILMIGFFREHALFTIPAAASLFLVFTMIVMLTGALNTLMRGWASTVLIVLILLFNYAYQFKPLNYYNKAYGLNYETEKARYDYKTLKELDSNSTNIESDIQHTINILDRWRKKNAVNTIERQEKPKLFLINTSGGGLRSSLWTMLVMQHVDSILNGQLLPHISMITGSSGGMVGAAYMRELYLRHQLDSTLNYYDKSLLFNMSKDILNPVTLSIAVNDWFLRLQTFKVDNYTYIKDRAYSFEKQLNQNTNYVLDKKLIDYKLPEESALIPMMILTPTIINDGRRLLISPQPVSYLTQNTPDASVFNNSSVEAIEFTRFFEKQDAYNLKFTSAIRMNATFPYIMPYVSLPSEPVIDVMDAGIRDNFGMMTSLKFLYVFRNWISTNTSGVVIIQIRDRYKEFPIADNALNSITQSISRPLLSFYNNLFYIEDFNNDQLVQYASLWFDQRIDIIDFQLRNDINDRISLSWHLTEKEKQKVYNSLYLPENKASVERIKKLLE